MTQEEILEARRNFETIIGEGEYVENEEDRLTIEERAVNDLWDFLCSLDSSKFEIEVGKKYVARFKVLTLAISDPFHLSNDSVVEATGIGDDYIRCEYDFMTLFVPINQFKACFKPLEND